MKQRPSIFLIDKIVSKKEVVILNENNNGIRKRKFCLTRQIIMAIAQEYGYSQKEAGDYFGLNHCTALWAKGVIANLCDTDRDFYKKVEGYKKIIKDGLYTNTGGLKLGHCARHLHLIKRQIISPL
jgi:chromosomal replication initiation ATPase DnaA